MKVAAKKAARSARSLPASAATAPVGSQAHLAASEADTPSDVEDGLGPFHRFVERALQKLDGTCGCVATQGIADGGAPDANTRPSAKSGPPTLDAAAHTDGILAKWGRAAHRAVWVAEELAKLDISGQVPQNVFCKWLKDGGMPGKDIQKLIGGLPEDVKHKDGGLRTYALLDHLLPKRAPRPTVDAASAAQGSKQTNAAALRGPRPSSAQPSATVDDGQAQVAGELEASAQKWGFTGWLASLDIAPALARRLEDHLCNAPGAPGIDRDKYLLKYFRLMHSHQDEEAGKAALKVLLLRSGALDALVDALWRGGMELSNAAAESSQQLNEKFMSEGVFELSYGSLSDFFGGLEALVGSPDPDLRKAMEREHCGRDDSVVAFTTGNYGITTKPWIEWNFAAGLAPPSDGWPAETQNCKPGHEREYRTQEWMQEKMKLVNEELDKQKEPRLCEEEVIGLRLYTGPMFQHYNNILRALAHKKKLDIVAKELEKDPAKKEQHDKLEDGLKRFQTWLDAGNWYTTTIHVINSGLVKLGKIQKAVKVYRGFNGLLPTEFWKPNEWGICGGVENAFLSTTEDRNVAMSYASGGGKNKAGTVFEVRMGMVDRGANLSFISQYPYEKELCFPPLTGLQVISTRVEKTVLVVEARLNVNLISLTIEEVVAKRFKTVDNICTQLCGEIETLAAKAQGKFRKVVEALGLDESAPALRDAANNVRELMRARMNADVLNIGGGEALDTMRRKMAAMNDNEKFVDAVRTSVKIKADYQEPSIDWAKRLLGTATQLPLDDLARQLRTTAHNIIAALPEKTDVQDVDCNELTDGEVCTLATASPNLCKAKFTCCTLTTEALGNLATHCTQLKSVNFAQCENLTDQAVDALASLNAQLENVSFEGCPRLTGQAGHSLAKKSRILHSVTYDGYKLSTNEVRTVSFEDCQHLTDQVVEFLAPFLQRAESVNFEGCTNLTDQAISALAADCDQLQNLNLRECWKLTDKAVHALASSCKELHTVNLYYCKKLTDEAICDLATQCVHLQSVNFAYCKKLTDEAICILAGKCTDLQSVTLEGCENLTDKAIRALAANCKQLQSVNLRVCAKLTGEAFCDLAKNCVHLQNVNFAFCDNLTDKVLCDLATHCARLQNANFCSCAKLTDKGMMALASQCKGLRDVNFFCCDRLTDKSVRDLVDRCPELTKGNFRGCSKITSEAKEYAKRVLPSCNFVDW